MLKLVYFLITFTKAIFITPQTRLGVYVVFCLCYGFSETDRQRYCSRNYRITIKYFNGDPSTQSRRVLICNVPYTTTIL